MQYSQNWEKWDRDHQRKGEAKRGLEKKGSGDRKTVSKGPANRQRSYGPL
jgi:hypothetical protein